MRDVRKSEFGHAGQIAPRDRRQFATAAAQRKVSRSAEARSAFFLKPACCLRNCDRGKKSSFSTVSTQSGSSALAELVVALTFLVGRGSPAQTLTMQDADIALSARIRNDGTLCEPVVPLRRLIQRLGRGKFRVGIANATEPSKTGFREI